VPGRIRIRELRRRWQSAERRVGESAPGSPEWDAALAESEELEAGYMSRLNRILERDKDRTPAGERWRSSEHRSG
jgi:hypothetical protein